MSFQGCGCSATLDASNARAGLPPPSQYSIMQVVMNAVKQEALQCYTSRTKVDRLTLPEVRRPQVLYNHTFTDPQNICLYSFVLNFQTADLELLPLHISIVVMIMVVLNPLTHIL
jgi:hypothetical protein